MKLSLSFALAVAAMAAPLVSAGALTGCDKKAAAPTTEAKQATPKAPAKDQAKAPAKAPAKDEAKAPAKDQAKTPAKDAAKAPAKDAAKAPAKDQAKTPAKDQAKAPAKDQAQETGPPRIADFPDVPLQAKVGQWVFAPTRRSLEETKKNPKYRSPRYMQFQVVEVGPAVSKVKGMVGGVQEIPNAYLIPLPAQEPVAVGDVVLSARYGNDMELAVVTEAGTPPKADFVEEMPYAKDNVAPLKPGRYVKLDGTLRQGAAVALKEGDKRYSFATVVSVAQGKVFLAGFMGKARVAAQADVVPLELSPKLKVGDVVSARWSSGGFKRAKVKSVDPKAHLVGLKWINFPDDKIAQIPPVHVTKKLKLD